MPNKMSEDMSDKMPEDMSARKYINVMVGITRCKVFFLLFRIFIFNYVIFKYFLYLYIFCFNIIIYYYIIF